MSVAVLSDSKFENAKVNGGGDNEDCFYEGFIVEVGGSTFLLCYLKLICILAWDISGTLYFLWPLGDVSIIFYAVCFL